MECLHFAVPNINIEIISVTFEKLFEIRFHALI